ncbi:CATRA system-associated protein [Streptomyces sp. NPDC053780]|uniref:CATRA system-associated protein n=1 Tax=unclassified Streptomyces TaxID=2593676 RepID=UPI0034231405
MDDEIRAEALDVLREASEWRLAAERWPEVERLVDAMGRAASAGDAAVFRRAVYDLEAAGPRRAVRAERAAVLPPQASLRERINTLVHSLDDARSAAGEAPDVPEQTHDRAESGVARDGGPSLRRRRWAWRGSRS